MIRIVGDDTYQSSKKKVGLFLIIKYTTRVQMLTSGKVLLLLDTSPVDRGSYPLARCLLLFAQTYRCGCSLISLKKSSTICSCEY